MTIDGWKESMGQGKMKKTLSDEYKYIILSDGKMFMGLIASSSVREH